MASTQIRKFNTKGPVTPAGPKLHYRNAKQAHSSFVLPPNEDEVELQSEKSSSLASLTKVTPHPAVTVPSSAKVGQAIAHSSSIARPTKSSMSARGVSTATTTKRVKSKLGDLPSSMRQPFLDRFVPLVRQYMGTIKPWKKVELDEFRKLYEKAFGRDTVDEHGALTEGDDCWRLIHYRIDDWHTRFASTALTSLQEVLEDPDNADVFSSPDAIAERLDYLPPDKIKEAPLVRHLLPFRANAPSPPPSASLALRVPPTTCSPPPRIRLAVSDLMQGSR
ncbi:hypothetical protein BD414DRAFT_539857 [Trametes punicea]|nr:hypothetical protein BD414DRAFT_539857 [Trametes punicea]